MLIRRFGAGATVTALLLSAPAAAMADVGGRNGTIWGDTSYTSQQDGYDGRGGGPRVCKAEFRGAYTEVPCADGAGWWSNTFNCYMRPAAAM